MSKFHRKPFGLTFIGTIIFLLILEISRTFEGILIKIFIAMFAWMTLDYFIEWEVNKWLKK